jgi:hypothetical protein
MSYQPTHEWNGIAIVSLVVYRYLAFVVVLLALFVVCTAFHIGISPFDADNIVRLLGHFWLPLPPQYEAIKFVNGDVSAGNYAFFNLILFCMYPVLLFCAAYYYNRIRKTCAFPKVGNKRDLAICALIILAGIILVLLDYPSGRPGVSSFRADMHGWYFFRQAFLTTGVIVGPMMLVVFMMRLAVGYSGEFRAAREQFEK